ncbi:MAG: phosphatidate cytidylyltransferase [Alphaproteobacteria bacterium]|nr:phosphatidate cytidylyltransferase [Alphaproteobacteria bacterium]MCB9792554.1 phosphatidate cytidylyltransferase [Alphaproteobacteria bacterium]
MIARLGAAFVGLLIILPALIWGGSLGVEVIVGLVMLIAVDEYGAMAFPGKRPWALISLVPPSVALYATALYAPVEWMHAAWVGSALWVLGRVLFRAEPVDDAANASARLVLGLAWVPALVVYLPLLRRLDHGLAWVFFALAVTWLGDTGGYFGGRFFGKHKLYPKISPKKTWEGVAGGVVFAVGAALVVRELGLPDLGLVECVVAAVVLDLLGVVGDLVESMLKRSFGVKDSGWIMPGHGGILDRIDGLLVTGPVLYALLQLAG